MRIKSISFEISRIYGMLLQRPSALKVRQRIFLSACFSYRHFELEGGTSGLLTLGYKSLEGNSVVLVLWCCDWVSLTTVEWESLVTGVS